MSIHLPSDATLDAARRLGDPLADSAIAQVFSEGKLTGVNQLLGSMIHNDDLPPEELPASLKTYLIESSRLPPWADPKRIAQGEAMFSHFGLTITMALFCASLPYCYTAKRGVQVLAQTGRLQSDIRRRIIETAQFLLDVMAEGGLAKGGAGIRSSQKVRLMHAAIRYLLLHQGWHSDELGIPINQEDLAGTLFSFSVVPLRALRKLGVSIPEAQAEAYVHTWNVVGHILGVREEFLMGDEATATALFDRIIERNAGACPEGQLMTRSLIELLEYTIPGNAFDGFPSSLARFFLGDHYADLLAMPPSDWSQQVIGRMRFLNVLATSTGDRLPGVADAVGTVSRLLLQSMVWVSRGPKRAPLSIPDSLKSSWGI